MFFSPFCLGTKIKPFLQEKENNKLFLPMAHMIMPKPTYNQTLEWIRDGMNSSTKFNIVCFAPSMISTNGIWQEEEPLNFSLPMFLLQLSLIVILTRVLKLILKPLRQPQIVGEILTGVLLGPSALGSNKDFAEKVFPLRSIMVLQTMANVGLLYFLFLVGLKMDLKVVTRTKKKPLIIAVVGMTFPFIVVLFVSLIIFRVPLSLTEIGGDIIYGVGLSTTASPVLVGILADIKLFNTDLGQLAMSAAYVNDICAWILLLIGTVMVKIEIKETPKIFGTSEGVANNLLMVGCLVAFFLICILVVRPSIIWIIKKKPEGESFNDFYIFLILSGVMISGFITDATGTHPVFGAFIFGLIIPNGTLGTTLIEKLEDFVTNILLPLYFTTVGLRTDINELMKWRDHHLFVPVITPVASIGKSLITFLVAFIYNMSLSDGLSLALLMNTKGVMELIILNLARDVRIIYLYGYTIMVIVFLLITSIITPIIVAIYKPSFHIMSRRRRTIQMSMGDAELRILVGVHTPRNVPTILNLLKASNPTDQSPMCIYALNLVELTSCASSMLIVHFNAYKFGRSAGDHTHNQSEHIIQAFENYAQEEQHVTVLPLTAISPYSTMHQDICNLAEDKRITLIIVPFHKHQTVDGGMEATNPSFRAINQNVLASAPCSVGILVDKGFIHASVNHTTNNIAVLFFGGPDDREALAYACKMAENPSVSLTVVRFLQGEELLEVKPQNHNKQILKEVIDTEKQKRLDDEYICDFRLRSSSDSTIEFKEKVVNNAEDIVAAIRAMDNIHDLYIIGRRQYITSSLSAGITEWCEFPELGAIGDLLASSDHGSTMSVLVMQQYTKEEIDWNENGKS